MSRVLVEQLEGDKTERETYSHCLHRLLMRAFGAHNQTPTLIMVSFATSLPLQLSGQYSRTWSFEHFPWPSGILMSITTVSSLHNDNGTETKFLQRCPWYVNASCPAIGQCIIFFIVQVLLGTQFSATNFSRSVAFRFPPLSKRLSNNFYFAPTVFE